MVTTNQFEYTTQGYIKAKEWLESINDKGHLKGFSIDGWSIIHYANELFRKLNGKQQ